MWTPARRRASIAAAEWPAAPASRRAAGLTLIELLVALVILTVVLTLAYGSFFQISGAATSLKEDLAAQQELRTLLKIVSDDLHAARFFKNFADSGRNPSGIVARVRAAAGREFSAVDFHAASLARLNRQRPEEFDPGVHEVGYTVEEDPATREPTLVRREDYYVDSNIETGGVKVVLSRRIETFSLAFLPPSATPGAEQWSREWDSRPLPPTANMPSAIRIGLGVKTQQGVPLRATLEVNLPTSSRVSK